MQDLGWSDEHSFQAAPAVGPDTTVRLLAIADMGQAQEDHSNQVGRCVAAAAFAWRLGT